MPVEIAVPTDQIVSFLSDIVTLVLQVFWEDFLLETFWNKLAVPIFVDMGYKWGFALILCFCLFGLYQKYVAPYR